MRLRAAIVRTLPPPAKRVLLRVLPRRLTQWNPPTRRVHLAMPVPPSHLGPPVRAAATPPTITLVAPWRSYVPRLLEEHGVSGYEPQTMAAFLAATSYLRAGDVLDVGANVGIFSIISAATTTARVTGFEPTPSLAATFRDACSANGLTCAVEEIALGRTSGSATLFLSARTDSSNSLRAGHRAATGTIDVPVERLDDWVARTGSVPRVMKMDTETTEPDVLEGGLEVLAAHRPWIVCEVLANSTEAALMAILRPLGYSFHHIGAAGPPVEADEIVGDPTWLQRDWLFTPGPLPEAFTTHYRAWLTAIQGG